METETGTKSRFHYLWLTYKKVTFTLIFQLITFSAPSNGSYRIIGGQDAKPSEWFLHKHQLNFHLDLGPVPP